METIFCQDRHALEAQQDEEALAGFIEESRIFILRSASKVCKRFITDSDDEYGIALEAFWEAVRTYKENAGHFAGFAALVIRRRLMDWFDSQSRHSREIPAGHSLTRNEETGQVNGVIAEAQKSMIRNAAEDPAALREEIEALGEVLEEYGFSFFDLAKASPKAAKTRNCCARAVNWMLEAVERLLQMRRTRSLPTGVMVRVLGIARKILERHRRYIIAATEILDGDYPHLAEYMDYIRKERSV